MKQVLAVLVAALACWPVPARADEAPASEAAPVEAVPVEAAPVVLQFSSDTPSISEESVRAALAAELGVRVLAANDPEAARCTRVLTITHRALSKELSVTYAEAGRASVTRVITAPELSEQVPSKAALLAGNLSRNEARDWASPTQPAVAPPPEPPREIEQPLKVEIVARPTAAEPPRVRRIANAGLFYPLASNYEQPDVDTNFELNLLYGHIGSLEGLGIGTVSVMQRELRGLSISLLTSLVGRDVRGVQLAGGYNSSGGDVSGFQVAGFANHARAALSGGQFAFGANLAGAQSEGVQAALGANFGAGLTGLQAAGVVNLSTGALRGAQVAFGVNYARDVEGLQLALINVGRRVRGAQIGLFNVADDVEGVPIGLVSVTRTGGIHPMLWASTSSLANVGLKFATRYTYTFLNLSFHHEDGRSVLGPGFALGANFPLLPQSFGAVDFGGSHLFGGTACCHERFFGANARRHDITLFKLRGLIRYQFLPHLSAFGGAAAVVKLQYPLDDDADTIVRTSLGPEGFAGVEF